MPFVIKKTPKGYGVFNLQKKKYRSFNTTLSNAQKQFRILKMLGY